MDKYRAAENVKYDKDGGIIELTCYQRFCFNWLDNIFKMNDDVKKINKHVEFIKTRVLRKLYCINSKQRQHCLKWKQIRKYLVN